MKDDKVEDDYISEDEWNKIKSNMSDWELKRAEVEAEHRKRMQEYADKIGKIPDSDWMKQL